MSGFIEGEDRHQATLFPESLDEYIAEDSAVRVIDVFIDDLDISGLGFKTEPADTGRPGYHAEDDEYECPDGERLEWRFETEEKGQTVHKYWTSACLHCSIKSLCTSSNYRRITRWEYEEVIEELETRLDHDPDRMRARRETVEHPFGTIESWMGSTHFQMKTLPRVSTEMSLHVLAYNLKRVINIMGAKPLMAAIRSP